MINPIELEECIKTEDLLRWLSENLIDMQDKQEEIGISYNLDEMDEESYLCEDSYLTGREDLLRKLLKDLNYQVDYYYDFLGSRGVHFKKIEDQNG